MPIPRDRLTAPRLARALVDLTETPKYRVAARELGERLRLEQGEFIAANIIEHELRKWLARGGPGPRPGAGAQPRRAARARRAAGLTGPNILPERWSFSWRPEPWPTSNPARAAW